MTNKVWTKCVMSLKLMFVLQDLAHQTSAVRRRVALIGARTILKMIFADNFVHGDLHPGNILVR